MRRLGRLFRLFTRDLWSAWVLGVRTARRAWRAAMRHKWATVLWVIGGVLVVLGLVFIWAATIPLPDLSTLKTSKISQSLQIYDRTGSVLLYDLSHNVQRTIVPLSAISPNIQDAIISIEDPNFYEHRGVEVQAILRAIWVDFTSLSSEQGGSTITQQVIKGSVLTNDKTITRKLKEWVLALKLERELTKDQILELYLNQVPMGGRLYGVEAASEAFFNKHASDLSVPEAAYIAAVLPAPSYYSPYGNHKDELDARKNLVLDKMAEHGYITQDEAAADKAVAVDFQAAAPGGIEAPHFVFYVEQYLEQKYGTDALAQSGWVVTTTIDMDLQRKAEDIVSAGALKNATTFNASNAGLVAVDPKTGQILAMVGSRNYFDTQIPGAYNIAVAARQPGSAFKPFAYAEAFEKGYEPSTVVFDVPTQFSTVCSASDTGNNTSPCYAPSNYDNKFRGPMSLRDALAQSINIPAIKVLYLAGLSDTLQLAKSMGISTLGTADQYGLTLVLGGGEVTLVDMTNAYGAFANDGVRVPDTPVLKITDNAGNVIEDNSQQGGVQVVPTDVAQKINDVLSDPVARAPLGENDLVYFPGHDVAVKTGTTNDYRDAWTIGYTPDIAVGMWAGNNDNSPMVKKVSGFIVGPMWHDFMTYAITRFPNDSFSRGTYTPSPKPILNGAWQTPGSDGQIHEILYWIDKGDPLGPPPSDPTQDPQYLRWDVPVRNWLASNYSAPAPQQPVPVQNNPQPVYNPMGGSIIPQTPQ
ncbi:MAG: PBP1A family penicillin-binding protein [Patescibacteria group bacterium]|nr:PBP1A family penicillin-binding protein [Patescibacteria group bacterium]